MTKAEEDFIKRKGALWHKALMAATIAVRGDGRFVGLDKIRDPAAVAAALKALGYEKATSAATSLTRLAASEGASHAMLDSLIDAATDAAKKALRS